MERGQSALQSHFRLRSFMFFLALCGVAATTSPSRGADAPDDINWTSGPAKVTLGSVATLEVPVGYRFTGAGGAQKWMTLSQNPADGSELGILIPPFEVVTNPKTAWFIILKFTPVGYVKDDEKGLLGSQAATSILEALRQDTQESNKERINQGWPTLTITGWQEEPFYDSETHHFTWATFVSGSDSSECVNYNSRILGRHGVMVANMVLAPDQLAATVPTYRMIISGLSFLPQENYSEFRSGDNVAKYGLTGLITGTAVVVAAKSWKPLIAAGAAFVALVGAGLKKLKNFLPGGKSTPIAQPAGVSADGSASIPNAQQSSDTLVKCPQCGQENRVTINHPARTAKCGRCHQPLPVSY